jgi:hypothetical protein
VAALAFAGPAAAAQEPAQDELAARVWLDRGEDPVVRRGERVQLYYRSSHDAYVSIFHIDTNGTVRLLFPRSPEENHFVAGGRDYRLLFPLTSWWHVEDDPGVGYFFMVASPEPFDFTDFPYDPYDRGWDLSFAGSTVASDPYAAMDEYIARLIPDWEYVPYALDFSSYHVQQRYDYPRFLCYDCHDFRPYAAWNPYFYSCSTYRVVVYDDPYYYPIHRYRGDRVVWVRPGSPGTPRFEFKERARGEPGTPLVASRTDRDPVADRPGVGGSSAPRRSTSGIGSGGVGPLPRSSPTGRGVAPGSGLAPNRPGAATPRRPSDVLPGRGEPRSGSPLPRDLRRSGEDAGRGGILRRPTPTDPERTRPVLERRKPPTGGGGAGPARVLPRVLPRTGGSGGGGTPPARARPPARGGGGSAVPTRRSGGGAAVPTPPARVKPPARGGGGGAPPARARPSGRGGGNAPPARARPPSRGGGGSPPARPPARKRGGGGGGAGAGD